MSALRATWSGRSSTAFGHRLPRMTDNDVVKRLLWAGLLAGLGALASVATSKLAAVIWRRAFGEDPPE
jgi:hypothetical protein